MEDISFHYIRNTTHPCDSGQCNRKAVYISSNCEHSFCRDCHERTALKFICSKCHKCLVRVRLKDNVSPCATELSLQRERICQNRLQNCTEKAIFCFMTCKHSICNRCLLRFCGYIVTTQEKIFSTIFCPQCLKNNSNKASWTYLHKAIPELSAQSFCSGCFENKAACEVHCGHLICFSCLNSMLTVAAPVTCSIKGCKKTYERSEIQHFLDDSYQDLTSQFLTIPSKNKCEKFLCRKTAVVMVRRCNHSLCIECVNNVMKTRPSNSKMIRGKDFKMLKCPIFACSDFPQLCLKLFMDQLYTAKGVMALCFEFCKGTCLRKDCQENPRETNGEHSFTKELRIRLRMCGHQFCLKCLTQIVKEKKTSPTQGFFLNRATDILICPAYKCHQVAPVSVIESLISACLGDVIREIYFLTRPDISRICNICNKNKAILSVSACEHDICKSCLDGVLTTKEDTWIKCPEMFCNRIIPKKFVLFFLGLRDKHTPKIKDGEGDDTFSNVDHSKTGKNQQRGNMEFNRYNSEENEQHVDGYEYQSKEHYERQRVKTQNSLDSMQSLLPTYVGNMICESCKRFPVFAVISGCKHGICLRCLEIYIASSENGNEKIHCPYTKCPSAYSLTSAILFKQRMNTNEKKEKGGRSVSEKPDTHNELAQLSNDRENVSKQPRKQDNSEVGVRQTEDGRVGSLTSLFENLSLENASGKTGGATYANERYSTETESPVKSYGLRNGGLACYRNSILQILAHTPLFKDRLEKWMSISGWVKILQEIIMRIYNNQTEGTQMEELLEHFQVVFFEVDDSFRSYQQNDSLSFLTSLLNGISEDKKEKKTDKHQEEPSELFKGILHDKYTCCDCDFVEHFAESETSFMSLPLPTLPGGVLIKPTLETCLCHFFETEILKGFFACAACCKKTLQKELQIKQFPSVLVLQIGKIQESGFLYKSYRKIGNGPKFGERFNINSLCNKMDAEVMREYRLYGVVVHIGSMSGGHYYCYVKDHRNSKWYKCDDTVVQEVQLKNVLDCDAYLLFYERCNSTNI